jgi:hypothetical protein
MNELDQIIARIPPGDEYARGYIDALLAYSYTSSDAWAENGVRYVGTTGKTLVDAAREWLDGDDV